MSELGSPLDRIERLERELAQLRVEHERLIEVLAQGFRSWRGLFAATLV